MLPHSAFYQNGMHRLIAAIAILFAFAALTGATVAHAHRYVSTPIVVLNHVDAQNQPIPVYVQIQRGQIDLGGGIVMPCGSHPAIIGEASLPCPSPRCCEDRHPPIDYPVSGWDGTLPLRPPITA